MLHGGRFFSSGNDLSYFFKYTDVEEAIKIAEEGVKR